MILRSFQRLSRVASLSASGALFGDWAHVPASQHPGYRAMVAAMSVAGVDTGDRPPIWAWHGELHLVDAALLFDEQHELRTGYATVEFDAPDSLVTLSDYGAWNDHLYEVFHGRPACWSAGAARWLGPPADPDTSHPAQACLPHLRAEWLLDVRPLPAPAGTNWMYPNPPNP